MNITVEREFKVQWEMNVTESTRVSMSSVIFFILQCGSLIDNQYVMNSIRGLHHEEITVNYSFEDCNLYVCINGENVSLLKHHPVKVYREHGTALCTF
jgi:hypothetical protein